MPSISPYSRTPIFPAVLLAPATSSPSPSSRSKRSAPDDAPVTPTPAWTLLEPTPFDTAEGDTTLARRLAAASSNGQTSVSVPRNSSLGDALGIYVHLLSQPQTLIWFANKGLELGTLTIRKHGVEGYVSREGVRTFTKFSTSDDSGWWQVSQKLRAICDALDPTDKGLPYLDAGEHRVPLHVVEQAYAAKMGELPHALSPALVAGLADTKRVLGDLDERDYLAAMLEQRVQGMADNNPVDWSTQPIGLSPASARGIGAQPPYTVAQLLAYKGLGVPRTVADTRNVTHWLRTELPPAPQEGDYRGLKADQVGVAQWRALESPPGTVAGFELYPPAHMGRTLGQVRRDLEQYLCDNKGLQPEVAARVAQMGLAQVAPEFLVRDVADAITIGTPAWMELCLGCAIAEMVAPGTSRAMNEQQVAALTVLGPTCDEQRTLMQVHGLGVMLDWAVLNGVIAAKPQGQYTAVDIKKASQVFTRQRTLASRAFKSIGTPLPTRRALAAQELHKVFPGVSATQLEGMTVMLVDVSERRNLKPSEPRTRSLIETYMTGDLVPGKWILTRDVPKDASGQGSSTPFQFQDDAPLPIAARNTLDTMIRRLPALDALLKNAVGSHHRKQQMAFVSQLKLMFSALPLEDRQRIELGAVDLFTLRKPSGKQQVWESDEDRAAVTARQGTLMRVLHDQSVTYYEVLNSGKIVRHEDPTITGALDDVVRDKRYLGQFKLLGQKYIRGGHDVPLDFDAYADGRKPRVPATSSDVIIDRLGRYLPAGSLPANQTLASFVPDSYQSERVEFIACEIAEQNFYETEEQMLKRATGQLSVEKSREADTRQTHLLLSLVPFVGAYQEFAEGNIAKGVQSLALDVAGVAIGAGAQARSLVRSLGQLVRGRLGSTGYTVMPGARWALIEKKLRFGDAAFDLSKQTALFFNAVFNPLDGYPRLINSASRGLGKLPAVIGTGSAVLGKVLPHVIAVEKKMRSYLLVATGQANPATTAAAQGAQAPLTTEG